MSNDSTSPFADRNNDGVPDTLQTVMSNPSPPGSRKNDTFSFLGCAWKAGLVLLLALGGCPAYRYWYDRHGNADAIVDVVFAGDRVIGVESIRHTTSSSSSGGFTRRTGYETFRLSAIRLKDGSLVGREVLGDRDERSEYLGRAGGGYWFYGADPDVGLHTIDPVTLQPVHTRREIIARNPALASMIATPTAMAEHHYCIDTASGSIYVTTIDGHGYLIDPVTLKASESTGRPECVRRDPNPLSMRVELQEWFVLWLKGSPRQELVVQHDDVMAPTSLTFLNGGFVCETEKLGEMIPVDLGLPEKVLVAHDSRIGQGAVPILSLVALGKAPSVVWSSELKEIAEDGDLGKMRVEWAHRTDDRLIVVAGVRIYCIDPATGAVRWTRHF